MPWKLTDKGRELWERSQKPGDYGNNGLQPKWEGDDLGPYEIDPQWKENYMTMETDPNGEPLPEFALGWTPHGEPYYGEGLQGVWNRIKSNWFKEREEPMSLEQLRETADTQTINGQTYSVPTMETISNLGTFISSQWNNAPGFLMRGTRAISAGLTGLIGLADTMAKGTERVLGTASETLEYLGEGSPIPEYQSPQQLALTKGGIEPWDWNKVFSREGGYHILTHLPPWLSWLEELNPGVLAYNTARAVTAPAKDWESISNEIDQNWEASRIAYSFFYNDAIKAEYLRRFNAGEYQFPETLAMELEIPSAELGGQLVLDPLNFVEWAGKGLKATWKLGIQGGSYGKFGSLADEFLKIAPELEEAFKGARFADEAQASQAVIDLARVQLGVSENVANGLADYATKRGLLSLTQSGKQFHSTRRASTVAHWIARNSDNVDETLETFKALADIASGDETRTAAGLMHITRHTKAPKPLLSQSAQEFGILLEKYSDGGTWETFAKTLDKIKEVGQTDRDKGLEMLVKWADNVSKDTAETIFPTIEKALEMGQEIPEWQVKVARAHQKMQEGFLIFPGYEKINNFFSGIYMGLSPGYAFRNSFTNNFQLFIDYGPSAYGKGTFFKPQRWVDKIRDWGIDVTEYALQGFGPHTAELGKVSSALDDRELWQTLKAADGEEWFQAFSRMSEKMEQRASMRVVGYAIDQAMRKMLKPGRALPDVKPLLDAGFSKTSVDVLTNLVINNGGDVWKARDAFMNMAKTGSLDAYSNLAWLSKADAQALHDLEIFDDFLDIVKEGTVQEQWDKLDNLYVEMSKARLNVNQELAGINPDSDTVGIKSLEAFSERQAAGDVSEESMHIVNNQAVANSKTFTAWRDAIHNMHGEINRLFSQAQANGVEGVQDALEKFNELVKSPRWKNVIEGTDTAVATAKDNEFLDEVWALTRKINNEDVKITAADINKIWDEKIPFDKPFELTANQRSKRALRNALWDGWFRPMRKQFWNSNRNTLVTKGREMAREVEALIGDVIGFRVADYKPLQHAEDAYAKARILDDVWLNKQDGQLYMLSQTLRNMMSLNRPDDAVRILAQQYGIHTATKLGYGFDNYLVNALKKYTGREDIVKVGDVTIDEAWEAFEAMRQAHGNTEGRLYESLDVLLGRYPDEVTQATQAATQAAGAVPEAGNIINSIDDMIARVNDTNAEPPSLDDILELVGDKATEQQINDLRDYYSNIAGYQQGDATDVVRSAIRREVDNISNKLEEIKFSGEENIFFRGTTPGATERIRTGNEWWDSKLFVADNVKSARGYGESIEAVKLSNDAKILREGTKEFDNIAKSAPEGSMLDWAEDIARKAEEQGYDAVKFKRQGDIGTVILNDDAVIRNYTPSATQAAGAVEEVAEEVNPWANVPVVEIPITPPYDDRAPTAGRIFAESEEKIAALFNKLKLQMNKYHGNVEGITLGDEMGEAMGKWLKTGDEQIAEARLMAAAYGNEARAFTLHDYPAKRNLDLVLSYIMPYNFWYTRTYTKWLTQRIWQNPGTIAAYAKYKTAMEKMHAGAPDWWKYNVNTNELLGLDADNPLFFNLEATLNPLNGLLGVDFNDPYKRVDWWTSTMDAIGRFGPSVWTPISLITASYLYKKGERDAVGNWDGQDLEGGDYTEAAARWAGRLIPQSATLKSLTGLLGIGGPGGVELDPATLFFSGGIDPYERRRVGRALGIMVEEGMITEAQANDAAYMQTGDIWDMARDRATQLRGWGQLSSFFMGVGFKSRNPQDMEIDKFYNDYNMLWKQEPNMTPEEFRTEMSDLRNRYPFMDAVLISKKGGLARDRAYAYNVLSRIPPSQSDDIAEMVGISGDLLSKFYDDKGRLNDWQDNERQRFMSGVRDIGAMLDLPDNATQADWDNARNAYSRMKTDLESRFGEDIWDKVDIYYQFDRSTQEGRDASKAFLEANPIIEQAMNTQTQRVLSDPLLAAYYGSIDKLEGYMKGQMYDEIENELGDVLAMWDEYYYLKDTGGEYRQYYKANEATFDRYREIRDEWDEKIAEKLLSFQSVLREAKPAWFREDAAANTVGQQQLMEDMQPQNPYTFMSREQWQITLGTATVAMLRRGEIPDGAEQYIEDVARGMGMTIDELIDTISNAR